MTDFHGNKPLGTVNNLSLLRAIEVNSQEKGAEKKKYDELIHKGRLAHFEVIKANAADALEMVHAVDGIRAVLLEDQAKGSSFELVKKRKRFLKNKVLRGEKDGNSEH